MLPLRGYVVLPWTVRQQRHLGPQPDMIEYGVAGTRPNTDYRAAGLEITYRLNGSTYTQKLYSGGADCVGYVDVNKQSNMAARYNAYCAATGKRANSEFEKIAGRPALPGSPRAAGPDLHRLPSMGSPMGVA